MPNREADVMPFETAPSPAASSQTASVTWIHDEVKFYALRDEWNRLAAATTPESIFLRHEWFDAAWQWAREASRLSLLCVYRNAELIGICPLVEKRNHLSLKTLGFLAVPDTQLCSVLAAPALVRDVMQAVAKALRDSAARWDVLQLDYLRAAAPSTVELQLALSRLGLTNRPRSMGTNLVITLAGGWPSFYATRGRRLKKSNNLVANRLKESGELRLEGLQGSPDANVCETWLRDTVDVSLHSWKRTTGLTLERPGPGAFIRRLTEHARSNGWISLWRLSLNGEVVATEYQIRYRGDVHALRADFRDSLSALSPGSYLNWKMLEQLFVTDAQRYYMGPGSNAYKLRWSETGDELMQLVAYGTGWRAQLRRVIELLLKPAARRALGAFRSRGANSASKP
jgi:CelD/BcsL family acetyltransferase involved in cellulose biosynthesis